VNESIAHFDHELHRMSLLHFGWRMLHLTADGTLRSIYKAAQKYYNKRTNSSSIDNRDVVTGLTGKKVCKLHNEVLVFCKQR